MRTQREKELSTADLNRETGCKIWGCWTFQFWDIMSRWLVHS